MKRKPDSDQTDGPARRESPPRTPAPRAAASRESPARSLAPRADRSDSPAPRSSGARPPLRVFTTTLWEYPSQHFDSWIDDAGNVVRTSSRMQGDKDYAGATPSWIIWQLLMRYTREGDLVVDPMCGSGTTLDTARELGRKALGYDLSPTRDDVFRADARKLPLESAKSDFVFIDPPYSTHIDYSDDPACIGKLDAAPDAADGGKAYYAAMERVIAEAHRVLRPRRYMALYVSDSWRKRRGEPGAGAGVFMPIGFELFGLLSARFRPVDTICVVRQNAKLGKSSWNKAAAESNFFLRGFNYLFIMKKA